MLGPLSAVGYFPGKVSRGENLDAEVTVCVQRCRGDGLTHNHPKIAVLMGLKPTLS